MLVVFISTETVNVLMLLLLESIIVLAELLEVIMYDEMFFFVSTWVCVREPAKAAEREAVPENPGTSVITIDWIFTTPSNVYVKAYG